MSLDAWKIFYEVGLEGNITRAAERLFISQPAVSKAISKLEAEAGLSLFQRHAKGVSLSVEGQLLFHYIQKAMQEIHAGQQMISSLLALETGIVRIGISHTLCRHYFMPWLKSFHTLYPGVQIQVNNRNSSDTAKMLYAGELDFGIVSAPQPYDALDFYALTTISDIFVTNKSELVPLAPLSLLELTKLPMMLLEKGNTTRNFVEQHFQKHGVPLKADIEIGTMDFLIDFAKIGIGVAAVIQQFVISELENGTLFEIPITPKPDPRPIGVLTHHDLPLSKAGTAFLRHLGIAQ